MKIRRIILKGVRNFTDFDRCFEDSWNGVVPDVLLLIGPNGSGKTTLLNAIAGLWQVLYDFLEEQGKFPDGPFYQLLAESGLAALEIQGFLDAPGFWVFAGNNPLLVDKFVNEFSSELRIGQVYQRKRNSDLTYVTGIFYEPDSVKVQKIEKTKKFPDWYSDWREHLVQNVYGNQHHLANIVYLESETRILLPIQDLGGMTPEPDEFQWLARYIPSTSRKGSLQNYLFALKAVNPPLFSSVVKQVNTFLDGKQLSDFSPQTYQLLVQAGNQKHAVENLSSGEKQALLMLVTVIRRLEQGGVVMIDEPDLHLHVSLVSAFVSHLRKLVREKKGQLILASHAPELWRMLNDSEIVHLGKSGDQEVVA